MEIIIIQIQANFVHQLKWSSLIVRQLLMKITKIIAILKLMRILTLVDNMNNKMQYKLIKRKGRINDKLLILQLKLIIFMAITHTKKSNPINYN